MLLCFLLLGLPSRQLSTTLQPASASALAVTEPSHSSAEYASTWKSIDSRIRAGFYARKGRQAEMDRLLKRTKPLAEAAKTDKEFKAKVEDMIGEFGDSHFDFLTNTDQGYYMFDALLRGSKAETYPSIGAWFKPATSGYSVTMVLEGGEAEKAGLLPGDVILTANGKPFEPVSSFAGSVGHTVALEYHRAGVPKTCSATPRTVNSLDEFLQASRNTIRVIKDGKKKVGYMHLWTQANNEFKDALSGAVYGPLANTDAMILDLRDGFGGRPEGFADPFFRPDVELGWDYGSSVQTQHFGYGKPLIVLINGGSRSAKEILSFILKKSHRAKLIGTQTAGNVLGTSPARVNSWSYLEIPMVNVTADGVRLEKNGVKPDIEVKPERGPDGSDRVLQRALLELSH